MHGLTIKALYCVNRIKRPLRLDHLLIFSLKSQQSNIGLRHSNTTTSREAEIVFVFFEKDKIIYYVLTSVETMYHGNGLFYNPLCQSCVCNPLRTCTHTEDRQFDNFAVIRGKVVITTTFGATNDNKVIKLTIYCFQWMELLIHIFDLWKLDMILTSNLDEV